MFDKNDKQQGKRIPITDDEPQGDVATPPDDSAEEAGDASRSDDLLAALEAELAEVREAHLRAVADLQNFRRRSAEERAQQLQYANEQLILELLPVLDNFERATGCTVEGDAAENLLRGVCMVQQQFIAALGHFGVARMTTTGQAFDPALHDAVERVETDEVGEGTIVGEALPGYTLSGRVIRPAKVRVAVAPH
ncbi:nucleotide exchange factor GrpE [bacterium]|nr:nucleotide exchange factor GrpE [bacterium]